MIDETQDRRERLLSEVFGPGQESDPRSRARGSSRVFIRGLDMLTLEESAKATGRRLTALEAYDAYGFQKLYEVVRDGSAIISESAAAAGRVLEERRLQLGVPVRTVAAKTGLAPNVVEALERSARRPIREYERVARVLGLDERALSFRPLPEGNERVAVRLRTLADERPTLSPSSVASLSEAAWVAMTQIRLENELGLTIADVDFEPSYDYGSAGVPSYQVGYELAAKFRRALTLGEAPIPSMRDLAERDLGIPIIQTEIDPRIAGATVESAERRAIVLNVEGLNSDALVRRSTIAHELGHLLFDSAQHLEDLRVDEYAELARRADTHPDPVEQRANAFAVELLAPQALAVERYEKSGDLFEAVLDFFGVSFTAGRYQVWNGLRRTIPLDQIQAPNKPPEPDWDGRESYTLTYHPIRELASHPSRAGRFSAIAVRSAEVGLISWDTVAEWLYCSEFDAQQFREPLRDLYPEVFDPTRGGSSL